VRGCLSDFDSCPGALFYVHVGAFFGGNPIGEGCWGEVVIGDEFFNHFSVLL